MPRPNKRKTSEPFTTVSKVSRSVSLTQCSSDDADVNTYSLLANDPASQLSTSDVAGSSSMDRACNKCKKPVSTDAIHVTSIKCCLCENFYHGTCLEINNPTLIAFLHVVVDIGGWACMECRTRGGKAASKTNKKVETTNLSSDISFIKTQLNSISEALKNSTITSTMHNSNEGDTGKNLI